MTRRDRWLLGAITFTALVLRCLGLGGHDLAHDEPFTVVMVHRGLADLFAQLGGENNPPLYFLLMHGWVRWVPLEEAWLRLPSALFGALAIVPLFRLAHALHGTRTALTAALLMLFSAYHQGFAQEMRAYALLTLLTTLAFWYLWRCTHGIRWSWLPLTATTTALVYTHFMGWAALGLLVLAVLVLREFVPARKHLALALGATAVLFLPYAGTFLHRVGTSATQGTWLDTPQVEELYNMVWRWSNAPVSAVLLLLVTAAALPGVRRSAGIRLGLLWGLFPLVLLLLVSQWVPVFLDRYLVFAAPGFALLVAAAVSGLPLPQRGREVARAVIIGLVAITFLATSPLRPAPSAVVQQAETWRGQGIVLVQPPWYLDTYAWHLDHSLVRDPGALMVRLGERGVFGLMDSEDLPVALPDTVVLVDAWAGLTDPEGTVQWHLRDRFPREERTEPNHKVFVGRFTR